jgi:cell division septal protein FtsQ
MIVMAVMVVMVMVILADIDNSSLSTIVMEGKHNVLSRRGYMKSHVFIDVRRSPRISRESRK